MIKCKGKMKIGKIDLKTAQNGNEYAVGILFDKDTKDSIALFFAAFQGACDALQNCRVNDTIEFDDAKLVNANDYKKTNTTEDNNLRKLLIYNIVSISRQGNVIFENGTPKKQPKNPSDEDAIHIVEDDLPF